VLADAAALGRAEALAAGAALLAAALAGALEDGAALCAGAVVGVGDPPQAATSAPTAPPTIPRITARRLVR
jgi:hypothetical protein